MPLKRVIQTKKQKLIDFMLKSRKPYTVDELLKLFPTANKKQVRAYIYQIAKDNRYEVITFFKRGETKYLLKKIEKIEQ